MADALVSAVLEQLTTIILEEARQKWGLITGAREEIDKVRSNLESVHALLDDAEKREMRDKSIKLWLHRLKVASLDMEDVLDEWNTALLKWKMNEAQNSVSVLRKKVCHFISCFCLRRVVKLYGVAVQIKNINRRLDEIAKQKDRYSFLSREIRQPQIQPERETTSFVDGSVIHGRGEVKKRIISHLLCGSSEESSDLHLQTISIVGMGGIGKTALAQILYNDDQIKTHFDKRVWVCVSDLFDEARVARAIIIELEGQDHTSVFLLNSLPLQSLLKRICDSLGGKKFFLVLDDVWTEDDRSWDSLKLTFKHGAPGSRILVTTRKDTVVEIMESSHVFRLEELSQEVCWSILSQIAFINRDRQQCSDLNDIGWKIAKKCKGLPLAAKTLGSLLRFKRTREEWKDVLDNEIWTSEMIQRDIFAPLLLSYYDLPSVIRQCFLYCAIFPKDFEIWRYLVIQHWMAQGYLNSSGNAEMESVGREYFDYLAARYFFQDFGRLEDGSIFKCKMHDMVHDFVLFLTESDFVTKKVASGENSTVELQSEARHLTVMLAERTSFPASIHGTEKLRSVVTFCGREKISNVALCNLFKQSKCLRLLEFGWPDGLNHFENGIPDNIGQLMHLRHLNLSFALKMKKLPEAICELCNLLSLDLKGCSRLEKLPAGIGKLINLRFLRAAGCFDLTWYPKSMGRLASLTELIEVNIRVDHNDPKEFCIGDLEKLCHLRRLWVKFVGCNIDADEVRRARLHDKIHFQEMKIDLNDNMDEGYAVETLNPPPNLNVQFWTSYTDWYY
ncbi:hypothetical protein SLA2020_213740 [Shorea laevis]